MRARAASISAADFAMRACMAPSATALGPPDGLSRIPSRELCSARCAMPTSGAASENGTVAWRGRRYSAPPLKVLPGPVPLPSALLLNARCPGTKTSPFSSKSLLPVAFMPITCQLSTTV
jgi:hypothetical protein